MKHSTRGAARRLPPDVEPFKFEDDEIFELAYEVAALADDLATRHRGRRRWLAYRMGRPPRSEG